MRFELLLDNDLSTCDKARKQIEQEFTTTNYSPAKDYPNFGNFIEIDAGQVSEQDVWKIKDNLMKIEGVIDADPDVELEQEEEKINTRIRQESFELKTSAGTFPSPDWYHHDIAFPAAINYAKGSFQNGTGHFEGSNRIKVAQLDTGYTLHPEVLNFKIDQGHNFLRKENPDDPKDRLESTRPAPIFWGGHGTSCAGVMIGTNATLSLIDPKPEDDLVLSDQVNGVFPNIDLVPFRISRSIISFTNKMAKALDMIIDRGDIPIVSMSHATLMARRSHRLAIQEAVNKGIMIFAAPGSHIRGFKKVFTYPSKYPETIAVAASTVDKIPWELTHGGKEVDLCAPGYQMLIPFPYKKTKRFLFFFKRRKEYHAFKWSEGSSFSVPLTACAASLWMLHHDVSTLQEKYPGVLMTETFRTLLKNTAQPFSGSFDANIYGNGILDVNNLLKANLPSVEPPPKRNVHHEIALLSQKIKEQKKSFMRGKELMQKTLMAKINTEDKDEQLSEFVMDHATTSLKEFIKKDHSSEQIKKKVKRYVEDWYGPTS
jgi:hypothetical protein